MYIFVLFVIFVGTRTTVHFFFYAAWKWKKPYKNSISLLYASLHRTTGRQYKTPNLIKTNACLVLTIDIFHSGDYYQLCDLFNEYEKCRHKIEVLSRNAKSEFIKQTLKKHDEKFRYVDAF